MNIGEKLYELRKAKNLSQEEVAEKLNVTRQTVSKWETNQSTPDFDKILPLCDLFQISTEELLTGKKPEVNVPDVNQIIEKKTITKEEAKIKSAEVVSTSVFTYIVAVAFLIVAISVFEVNPIIVTSLFLVIVAWATARIIKNYMALPKFDKTAEEKTEREMIRQINGIVGIICTIVYFIISFATMAWHVTWIIFIINGLINQIIKLLFMLKEDKSNEK